MKRFARAVLTSIAFAAALPATASQSLPSSADATQVIARNAAARGGLDAWRNVQAMAWSGRIETRNAARSQLPFVLEQKRPNKTRFEITVDQQKSLRIFDGQQGWKLKPTSSGRPEAVAYSAAESTYAREAQVIDGPLMDFSAKGYPVTLDGIDDIQGQRAYRLSARLPSGMTQTVWVDSDSFLELRLDRMSRDNTGRPFTVSVYYTNYKLVEGLRIPLTIETRAADGNGADADRIVIERVALNPTLEDRLFSKPGAAEARHRGAVVVDTRSAAGPAAQRQP